MINAYWSSVIYWLSHAVLLALLTDATGAMSPQKCWALTGVMDKANQNPLHYFRRGCKPWPTYPTRNPWPPVQKWWTQLDPLATLVPMTRRMWSVYRPERLVKWENLNPQLCKRVWIWRFEKLDDFQWELSTRWVTQMIFAKFPD